MLRDPLVEGVHGPEARRNSVLKEEMGYQQQFWPTARLAEAWSGCFPVPIARDLAFTVGGLRFFEVLTGKVVVAIGGLVG